MMSMMTTGPTGPDLPGPPPGISVWERRVYDHLVDHIRRESNALAAYQALADASASEATRYLAKLILEDEARHHRVLIEIVNTIAAFPRSGPVPVVDANPDPELARAVEKLIDFERDDRKELSALAKELDPVSRTSLWALLVDMMREDTEKHLRILDFVKRYARRGLR